MVSYDPRGMVWDQWCSLMTELFAANQLGTVPEQNWRDWADGMQGIGFFVNSGVPDQRSYSDWRDWAAAIVGILSIGAPT